LIFTSDHQDDGEWTTVAAHDYPAGLFFDTYSESYVKHLAFETVTESHPGAGLGDYDDPGRTTNVPDPKPIPGVLWIDPPHFLTCPDQYVISHLGIRYDLDKGKIRQMRIACRPIE
jgi:hypothetical protein